MSTVPLIVESMKQAAYIFSVALFFTLSMTSASALDVRQPKTVIELYTSQGCSSCPPADKLMGEIVQKPDVLGLSFAVTYWDYIGWKDTFANSENDARQTRYRDQFGARYVYTPQMVVAGADHFVGSNAHELEQNLLAFKGHAEQIKLTWRIDGNRLFINLPDHLNGATIWQVDIDHKQEVQIGRGENTGKSITYHNIARRTQPLENWDGQHKTIELDLAALMNEGRDGCAILIQERGFGPIIAALEIDL
ncbi:DUF1223 domain-containing protein [Sneathiella aquimaris]|uniref:DUF1223 domain-containing protein n=1 Tax=Sneathiella aquimaris TaxID=2599305 RepID=UPI00146DBD3C|nr:DUF1223 domain-containing protein [Sneathiella aquimaris]